jgi:Holliday junction resolvase-like predicted endonuclease
LSFGDPLETISPRKQARVIRAARHFMATRRMLDRAVRFDVVGIVYAPELSVRLVRGAFESTAAW